MLTADSSVSSVHNAVGRCSLVPWKTHFRVRQPLNGAYGGSPGSGGGHCAAGKRRGLLELTFSKIPQARGCFHLIYDYFIYSDTASPALLVKRKTKLVLNGAEMNSSDILGKELQKLLLA